MAGKGKPGPKSKLDSINKEQVAKLAKAGWTEEQMADFFDVNRSTWYRWQKANPEFCEKLKSWKDEADNKVERSLYERATGGISHPEEKIVWRNGEPEVMQITKYYPPDSTAMIFWLKNRKPAEWRDKQDVDHGGNVAFNMDYGNKDD